MADWRIIFIKRDKIGDMTKKEDINMELNTQIKEAVAYIRNMTDFVPEIGLVLGSGLGDYADRIENPVFVPYTDIPHFPKPTVLGHAGRFVLGLCNGRKVMAMQGRFHGYEGYAQSQVTLPVRVMRQLGVKKLLLTNAAGGVNADFENGTLMMITDHINYSFQNPLIGENLDDFGVRFPDMTDVYDQALRKALTEETSKAGLSLKEGVYMMFSGPSYETPAEIRMARTMGADAVGMSTVPEALVANHSGMQIVGISCITNMAAGMGQAKLTHAEVMETAERVKGDFTTVLDIILTKIF